MKKAWHDANPMPPKAMLDQRVAWHVAHAAACGCREMPESVKGELLRRGEPIPIRSREGE